MQSSSAERCGGAGRSWYRITPLDKNYFSPIITLANGSDMPTDRPPLAEGVGRASQVLEHSYEKLLPLHAVRMKKNYRGVGRKDDGVIGFNLYSMFCYRES